jgi:ribokinase
MDLVSRIDQFPAPGETRTGREFGSFPGGKGANQAVALARLGGGVLMVGKVGNDVFGKRYREIFAGEGVSTDAVATEEGSNGVAVIQVNDEGENSIIVVPGANGAVTAEYVRGVRDTFSDARYFLFQLEIPLETVEASLALCKESDGTTIFDPAPAVELPDSLLQNVDIITPNESEARLLTGTEVRDEESARRAGEALLSRGVGAVVLKAGARGAYVITNDRFDHVQGFKVDVKDTTAAGDAFNAGLAFALGRGDSLVDATRFASAVGALSTTAVGAQSAMPDLAAAERLLGG